MPTTQLCPTSPLKIKNNNPLQEVIDFLNNIKSVRDRYDSFENIESAVKEIMNHLENALLSKSLEQYDINTKVIVKNNELYLQVLRDDKTYITGAGKVTVERSLYRGSNGTTICPLELQAGIVEGSWTPSAANTAYYITALLSPYQGEAMLKKLGRFTPSKSSLDRLSRKIGKQWDDGHDKYFNALTEQITIPDEAETVSVSFDGIMLPMKTKKTEATAKAIKTTETTKEVKEEVKKPFYKEAACAAVCFYDKKGERLDTIRFARMPEAKKKTLKGELSATIKHILNKNDELKLVKLADGAKDNWRYLSEVLRPNEGVEILDFFHAAEHLNKGIEAAYAKGSATAQAHFKKYRSLLKNDNNGVDKVIRTLNYLHKKHPKRKKITTELNYFRNNRHRMKYAQATQKNLPIGSGVTEASCKTLVTQRLKCSGMRWDIAGGQGILTARGMIQSNRFDAGWSLLADSYKAEISLPENVTLFKN